MKTPKYSQGFTLIELVVVVTILGILASIFLSERPFGEAEKTYLRDHKCGRYGFVWEDKEAVPTYKCDNGVWKKSEIRRLAHGEDLT